MQFPTKLIQSARHIEEVIPQYIVRSEWADLTPLNVDEAAWYDGWIYECTICKLVWCLHGSEIRLGCPTCGAPNHYGGPWKQVDIAD